MGSFAAGTVSAGPKVQEVVKRTPDPEAAGSAAVVGRKQAACWIYPITMSVSGLFRAATSVPSGLSSALS